MRNKAEQKVTEPRFTIKATGIGNRRMTNWKEEGLLPADFDKGTWRRFSYLQLIWFVIVDLLRSFDIPLKTIKQLKKSLFEQVSSWELFQHPEVRQVIDQMAAIEKLEPGYQDFPEDMVQAMKEDKHPWLFFLLLDAMLLRNHHMILVNIEGKFAPLKMSSPEDYTQFFNLPDFIANSFVSVSLTEVIRKSALKADVQLMFEDLGILTRSQVTLLSQLRGCELKSLRITLDNGNELEMIEDPEDKSLISSDRFLNVILTRGYRSLVAQSHAGMTYGEHGTLGKMSALA